MTNLSKLTVKSVVRASKQDPVMQRRQKLVAGIEDQMKVVAMALKGESYKTTRKTWAKNEQGEKLLVERMRNPSESKTKKILSNKQEIYVDVLQVLTRRNFHVSLILGCTDSNQ
ncbi:hypothetical protein [Sulfitobacter sp.]|uniref:hypothetical protein n=1 Tax=Sulfitobacter sp. TaxID=1903071 RepID=UPI0040596E3B